MAWLICGSVPDETFPLCLRRWAVRGERLEALPVPGEPSPRPLAVERGTPALMATACAACEALGVEPPFTLLCGDQGKGDGSRALYAAFGERAAAIDGLAGVTFHYLYPDLAGHDRVLMAIDAMERQPTLVADAGFMYVSKMSGYAARFDLFTPDIGELSFLADEKAPHPFYTRGFLLAREDDAPGLVERIWTRPPEERNCPRVLLVKGCRDLIVEDGRIVDTVDEPFTPALEAVGGTGDLVTGLVTALLAAGRPMIESCRVAARAARAAGAMASPTPATQLREILPFVGRALQGVLREGDRAERCLGEGYAPVLHAPAGKI